MSFRKMIEEWVAEGVYNHKGVLDRLYIPTDGLSTKVGHLIDNETGRIAEDNLVGHLRRITTLLNNQVGNDAAKIIYESLEYLSKAPFPWLQNEYYGLSLAELNRSINWLLPAQDGHWIVPSNRSRMRTRADHRRMIFQSLATNSGGQSVSVDIEEWRRLAAENVYDVHPDNVIWGDLEGDWTRSNNDIYGEEMYHDVVDILFATRPELEEWIAYPGRDDFRDLAKDMHKTNVRIYDLWIPVERFRSLLKFLIPAQFEDRSWDSNAMNQLASELDESIDCVIGAFMQGAATERITWPMFNYAMKHANPYLLNPLYDIVCQSLLGQPTNYLLHNIEGLVAPTPGSILTLTRFAQLGLQLSRCSYFEFFIRKYHYTSNQSSETLAPNRLVEQLQSAGKDAMLLVSGNSGGEKCIFGFYLPQPWSKEVECWYLDQILPMKAPVLYQLSPIHDTFQAVEGKSGYWTVSKEDLTFGRQDKGVSMTLTNGLRQCIFTQHKNESEEIYLSTNWRGNWKMDFQIDEMEVWVDETS